MKTSKSTLTVAKMALRAARDSLADHAKAKSPKKFTQPQLMACLVIKEWPIWGHHTYFFLIFGFRPAGFFRKARPSLLSSRLRNAKPPKGRPVRSCPRNRFASSLLNPDARYARPGNPGNPGTPYLLYW